MTSLGTPEDMLGWVLAFGTVSEVPVLFFGNYLLKWFKPTGLLFLTILLTGVRLLLFGVATNYQFGMVLQIFNGVTFPAMWMAGVAYADENAPPGLKTTAQGLFSAIVFGFGAATGGFVGGPLMESLGGHNLYLLFGSVILALMVLAGIIQRFMPLKPQLELEKEK
jgi:MFS family permease